MESTTSSSPADVAGDAERNVISGEKEIERDRRRTMLVERKRKTKKREFPPPIPSLARSEDQPADMPSVLKRYYTHDGRLVLREEKMTHHEYFRAHRSNGRLTLQLVSLNDVVHEPQDEDGESIECGEGQGSACSSFSSQPSTKCLDSCLLGVEVPVSEIIPPVHTSS